MLSVGSGLDCLWLFILCMFLSLPSATCSSFVTHASVRRSVQRSCEEGVVEPEAATGGDCSDDTIPATDGDTQLYVSRTCSRL